MQLNPNHYFLTTCSEINSIISPLKAFNINYFAYAKSYADGTRVCFTSHADDFQAYLKRKHYLQGNCEATPALYQEQALLWSTLGKQHLYQFARENFNIDHGMVLVKPSDEYCEFFAFASTADHPEVINFYLNNMDVIKNFSEYFIDTAKPLLKEAEKHKIKYPHHEDAIQSYSMLDLQKIIDKSALKKRSSRFKVSPRQAQCINFLLSGATTSEIAIQLGLSQRTIEYYINLLKDKFNARSKSDLIIKLLAHTKD